MPDLTKIATCNYCGTRSVLRLSGRVQHELSCASCGAKLHDMKPLKVPPADPPRRPKKATYRPTPTRKPPKRSRKRRKRRDWDDMFEAAFDIIEDIFD